MVSWDSYLLYGISLAPLNGELGDYWYMEVSWVMGVPPVIIHFRWGFSLTKTNLLGIPQFEETPIVEYSWDIHGIGCFSPPARWGLLDFMSVDFRLPPPSAAFCRLPPPSAAFHLLRTSTTTIHAKCSLPDLNHDHPRQVFPAGPQPRESAPSVPCRTSTATIQAQCSLPDLNRDHPRPVFPAGPQPRESTPSVPCRTSTAGENAKRYAR